MKALWNQIFYEPILNFLVYIMDVMPGHSLGLSIIIVTILIKFLILIPAQKGIRSQAALQKLQPEIQKLQQKYKDNKQVLAQKTMELYKKHNVSPFGSCLPMLIQFPILIALYFVARDIPIFQTNLSLIQQGGLEGDALNTTKTLIDTQMTHIYESLKNFDFLNLNRTFLGVDLVYRDFTSKYIIPIIIGILQFIQMFRMQSRKPVSVPTNKSKNQPIDPAAATKMMTYFMPVMIAFFAAQYPAALSLYWGMSTLFSIVQQEIVFRTKNK